MMYWYCEGGGCLCIMDLWVFYCVFGVSCFDIGELVCGLFSCE